MYFLLKKFTEFYFAENMKKKTKKLKFIYLKKKTAIFKNPSACR